MKCPDGCGLDVPKDHPNMDRRLWSWIVVTKNRQRLAIHAINSHEALLEAAKLAETYLEDGAPNSALRVLKKAIRKAEIL